MENPTKEVSGHGISPTILYTDDCPYRISVFKSQRLKGGIIQYAMANSELAMCLGHKGRYLQVVHILLITSQLHSDMTRIISNMNEILEQGM